MSEDFKKMGEKLKADTAQKEESAISAKVAGANELAALKANPTLAAKFAAAANKGSENLAGQLPQIKIFTTGKSTDELADGSEPKNGAIFYTLDKSEYENLEITVLTISRGFYALGLPDDKGNQKAVWNQILGGVFREDGQYKPFVIYFTGGKLTNLWEFGKEAKKFTNAKIPMFTYLVKLGTEKRKHKFGYAWDYTFEILKDDDGQLMIIGSEVEFDDLNKQVDSMTEMIDQMIKSKEVEKDSKSEEVVSVISQEEQEAASKQYEEGETVEAEKSKDVNPDDIPF